VTATVVSVDTKAATVSLEGGVEAVLRASEVSREKVDDIRSVLKEGAEIDVKITNIDRKNRALLVSIKAIEMENERAAIKDHKEQDTSDVSPGTIGELIKAQMDKD
jgi:small subunit ribosomal protein S1